MTGRLPQQPESFLLNNKKNPSQGSPVSTTPTRRPTAPVDWASAAPSQIRKVFRDLKVRPKLILLHNLFFVVLGIAVYSGLLPPLEKQIRTAANRESSVVRQLFTEGRFSNPGEPARQAYDYLEGSARFMGLSDYPISAETVFRVEEQPNWLFRRLDTDRFARIRMPLAVAESNVWAARWTLLAVLAGIYVLSVCILEFVIMPTYVYRPLTMQLDADLATIQGDRVNELVDESNLPDDEIGQIMRSRNAMVRELRKQEDRLAEALGSLEDANADLSRKSAQIETARQSLEQQDRLASLGLMSASVAHELNTPLAVLHGSIEKLRETVSDPSALPRLERMERVTQRLRNISSSLLDFARVQRTSFAPVALKPILDESWELVSIDERSQQVRFLNEIVPATQVNGNADRLIQVFVNLLRNALEATPDNGLIVAKSISCNGLLKVLIEDTGSGISQEILPGLFEAFVSSRLDSSGTGLGLTVAEGIVEQHGGRISARNRPEGGACIEIELPESPVWEPERTSE
jgi:signal transduction histidine kinase